MARIGQRGRYLEIWREVKPLSVTVRIAFTISRSAMSRAAWLTASVTSAVGWRAICWR